MYLGCLGIKILFGTSVLHLKKPDCCKKLQQSGYKKIKINQII